MVNIFKNLFRNLRCGAVTRVVKREEFEGTRGQLVIEEEKCIYCGICAKKCPAFAIKVDRKPNACWTFNPFKCILCGACVEACPKKCLHLKKSYRDVQSN